MRALVHIGSKLLYCLHTAWLNKAFFRRLDGFQARCMRKIRGIPHSYLSRVSNVEVLKQAAAKPYSEISTHEQLLLITNGLLRFLTRTSSEHVFLLRMNPRCKGRPQTSVDLPGVSASCTSGRRY